MKILIIHLSDSHLKSSTDEIFNKIPYLTQSIKENLSDADCVWLVLSGDITFSGKRYEYEQANAFLGRLQQEIIALRPSISFEYFVTPGNHDCDFSPEFHGDTREHLISSIIENRQLLNKQGIVEDCLKPQNEYFQWSSSIQKIEYKKYEDHFVQIRDFNFEGNKFIRFICFNTAWMSIPGKSQDAILFPQSIFSKIDTINTPDIVFSALHHPYNWLKSDISKSFRQYVETNSNVIFTGHEHEANFEEIKDIEGEDRQYIRGGELQGEGPSEFNTLLLDLDNRQFRLTRHIWKTDLYITKKSEWMAVPRSRML